MSMRSVFCLLSLSMLIPASQAIADDVCAAPGNLVQNCGFETGDFSGWELFGDTVHAGVDTVDAQTGTYGAFLAGFGSFNAGDLTFTDLEQVLNTTAGATYTLSFYWAHFANTVVSPDNAFAAFIDGNPIDTSVQIGIANQDYRKSAPYNFVAASGSTTLDFLAEDANFYFSLDNISVRAIPEPASLKLVAPLFVFLYFVRRNDRPTAVRQAAQRAL